MACCPRDYPHHHLDLDPKDEPMSGFVRLGHAIAAAAYAAALAAAVLIGAYYHP